MFFPYHLVGPAEVEELMRGWVDTLAAATVPDGAPDFADLPGDLLRVGPFDVLWAPGTLFTVRMTVDARSDRPAEPVLLGANLARDGRSAWRYCRNANHPEVGRDHLHLDADARLVGLPDPLTLEQLTARLLAEPR